MNQTRHRGKDASFCLRMWAVRRIFKDTFMTLAQRAVKDAEELTAVESFIIRPKKTHRELSRRQTSLGGTHKSEIR